MTTDRELLERAASAAGYEIYWKEGVCKGGTFCGAFMQDHWGPKAWNPLVDDGDALRLAVKLRILVDPDGDTYAISTAIPKGRGEFMISEKHRGDPLAATRRAIVCAAAALAIKKAPAGEDRDQGGKTKETTTKNESSV